MKKLLLLPLLLLTLIGCEDNRAPKVPETNNYDKYYVVLCEHHIENCEYLIFIHDTYTDNIYYRWNSTERGNLSPYYNKDGVIMKYSEFQRVHKHD